MKCHCHRVAVCGASLGAYLAANLAFRHPDAVSHLISLSGAFKISDFFGGYHVMPEHLTTDFGSPESQGLATNCLFFKSMSSA